MIMKSLMFLCLLALHNTAWAYGGGGGGGGSSCTEPSFTSMKPADSSSVQELASFSLEASANTQMETLDLQVNGQKVAPKITPLRTGDTLLEVTLAEPIKSAGKARITVRATSKEGCENFQPFYITIAP